VTHPDSGTTTVIDTATNTVIDTDGDARNGITGIAVGGQPMGVAVHLAGTTLYVADLATDTVAVIDTATHSTIDMDTTASNGITGIAVGPKPVGVAVHPAGSRVYVANEDCTISVIAVARSTPQIQPKVIDTIPVDDCANTAPIAPWGLAVTPDGTAVYVANAHEGGHPIVDAATLRVIGLIQGADGQPLAGGSQVLSQFIGPPGDATALALGSERALTGGTEESGIGLGQAASETTARDLSGFPVDQAAIRLAGPSPDFSPRGEPGLKVSMVNI
jgi:DNA-binding beta-propeller fold protein YncE